MNRTQAVLAVVLVLQLVLAGALAWSSSYNTKTVGKDLLSFDKDKVDRIVCKGEDKSVTLVKKNGTWSLPDFHGLPADGGRVSSLLDTLKELTAPWPVSTTKSSHERFEVADTKYKRKLSLYAGDTKLVELYIGKSPGFRKTYLRKADDPVTYTGELGVYMLPLEPAEWLDKSLLAAKEPVQIRGADFVLVKDQKRWKFKTIPSEVDQSKAEKLASAFTTLRVLKLEDKPSAAPVVTFKVKDKNGERSYSFYKIGDKHVVKRDDRDQYFSIPSYSYEDITGITKKDLVKSGEKAKESTADKKGDKAENKITKGKTDSKVQVKKADVRSSK